MNWNRLHFVRLASVAVAFVLGPMLIRERIAGIPSVSSALWAEDGNVFYKLAVDFGFASFLLPYAGYLHFYERLISLLAVPFGISNLPYVFLAGWLLAFAIMGAIVLKRSIDSGIGVWVGAAIVALIAVQPAAGEVFFSLTNAQWVLAVGLSIYLLVPGKPGRSFFELPGVALICMNGPFSIILVPLLMVKAFVLKDWRTEKLRYGVVLACAAVQSGVVAKSGRRAPPLDTDVSNWLSAFGTCFKFGGGSAVVVVAAGLFWALLLIGLRFAFRAEGPKARERFQVAMLLLFGAGLFMGASLYAVKHAPQSIGPFIGADRYFFIPYSLVFFAALLVASSRVLLALPMLACLGTVAFVQMRPIERFDTQFQAFAAFAKTKGELAIPLNPLWPVYPGWTLNYRGAAPPPPIRWEHVSLPSLTLGGLTAGAEPGHYVSVGDDPQIVFDTHGVCRGSRFVGVEAEVDRDRAGWVQLFWGPSPGFHLTLAASMIRYYPKGRVTMQFAFPNPTDELVIRIDPLVAAGAVNVSSVQIVCLSG